MHSLSKGLKGYCTNCPLSSLNAVAAFALQRNCLVFILLLFSPLSLIFNKLLILIACANYKCDINITKTLNSTLA